MVTLTPSESALSAQYEVLDKVMCFLLKNRVPPTLDMATNMFINASKDSLPAQEEMTRDKAREVICSFTGVGEVLALHWVPVDTLRTGSADEFRLELIFTKLAGLGSSHAKKRLKRVTESLVALSPCQQHEAALRKWCELTSQLLQRPVELRSTTVERGKCVLPSVEPPAPPSDMQACSESTDVYTLPPAPLDGDRAVTGVSSNNSSSSSSSRKAGGSEVDAGALLEALRELPFYRNQCVHVESLPAQPGAFVELSELDDLLSNCLIEGLRARGVSRLFKHQAECIRASLGAEQHVALSTGTSSGKSLAFNAPVFETLLRCGEATAIYLFPTKALAQDQIGSLHDLASASDQLRQAIRPATVDGDKCFASRRDALSHGNLIVTNPDMLHVTLLPNHSQWRRILENLRYVVIDEAHMYRGVFGAHVSCVLRRLLRLVRHYTPSSSPPRFIHCSATIANPDQHFAQLLPLDCLGGPKALFVEQTDSSPKGSKLFVLWNPPLRSEVMPPRSNQKAQPFVKEEDECDAIPSPPPSSEQAVVKEEDGCDAIPSSPPLQHLKQKEEDRRTSTIVEAARLFTSLLKQSVRTIVFSRTRKLTELVLRYSLQDLHATAPSLAPLVKGYRGGYTKADRRAIEEQLFSEKLLGVTATCALELGIDVGNLDATVHMGYPGSVASLWQQAGRAGRGGRASIAIFLAFDSPLEQLFMREPRLLFDRDLESAIVPFDNAYVLRSQLLCAAEEQPLAFGDLSNPPSAHGFDDRKLFGATPALDAVDYLVREGKLRAEHFERSDHQTAKRTRLGTTQYTPHPTVERAARDVSIRVIDPVTISIVDEVRGVAIDSIGYSRAFFELFEGAIYLHQARQYRVQRLDLAEAVAHVRPVRVHYLTSATNTTDVNPTKRLELRGPTFSGCVAVVDRVWGWRKIWPSGKMSEMHSCSLPALEYETRAMWIDIPNHTQALVEAQGIEFRSAIHGVNHAILSIAPLFVMCDPSDIDSEHVYQAQTRPRPPRVVVYDKRPGGIGIAESLFQQIPQVLPRALQLMVSCPCDDGCASCILHGSCSAYNACMSKRGAILVLRSVLKMIRHEPVGIKTEQRPSTPPPTSTASSEASHLQSSPNRAQRLRQARAMDSARSRGASLQGDWVASNPSHHPSFD